LLGAPVDLKGHTKVSPTSAKLARENRGVPRHRAPPARTAFRRAGWAAGRPALRVPKGRLPAHPRAPRRQRHRWRRRQLAQEPGRLGAGPLVVAGRALGRHLAHTVASGITPLLPAKAGMAGGVGDGPGALGGAEGVSVGRIAAGHRFCSVLRKEEPRVLCTKGGCRKMENATSALHAPIEPHRLVPYCGRPHQNCPWSRISTSKQRRSGSLTTQIQKDESSASTKAAAVDRPDSQSETWPSAWPSVVDITVCVVA
jgi:hypothetical protein